MTKAYFTLFCFCPPPPPPHQDLVAIKQRVFLATAVNNTFLAVTNQTIRDMNSNQLVALNQTFAKQVSSYTKDVTPPRLVSFDLDMDTATLTLSFDEAVNSLTLSVTDITLQDGRTAVDAAYTLTGGYTTSVNGTSLLVHIVKYDWDQLKKNTSVVTSRADSWIVFPRTLIRDMDNNRIVQRLNGDALQITNFTADTTPPELVLWTLDLDAGTIRFSFSETVNSYSFTPTEVVLQSENIVVPSQTEKRLQLSGANWTAENSTIIDLTILKDDLDELKRLSQLGVSRVSSFLSFGSPLVRDMNANPIVPILITDANQASNYTYDTTSPELVYYHIDMNLGFLFLTFSETVNRSTLDLTQLTFQAMSTSPLYNFTLYNHTNYTGAVPHAVPIVFNMTGNVTHYIHREVILNYTLTGGGISGQQDRVIFAIDVLHVDENRIKTSRAVH